MKLTQIVIILLLATQLASQESKYLDLDYGQNGVVEFDPFDHGIFEFCQSTNSIYLSTENIENDEQDVIGSNILVVNEDGETEVVNIGSTDLMNLSSDGSVSTWFDNNHFLRFTHNGDNFTIAKYSSYFEFEYEVSLDLFENYLFIVPRTINDGELILLNHNELHWFNIKGQPKPNFGINGMVQLNQLLPGQDYYYIQYNQFSKDEDEIIITNINNDASSKFSYSRILNDGSLDLSFGENGILTIEEDGLGYNTFTANHKDGYIVNTVLDGTIRLDHYGDSDEMFNAFKSDDRLYIPASIGYGLNYHEQLDNNYTLWTMVTETYNDFEDGLLDFALFVLDENGSIVEEIGDNGLIALENRNEFLIKVIIGNDNDIYLVFNRKEDLESSDYDFVVKKLDSDIYKPFLDLEKRDKQTILIYPNPISEQINIKYYGEVVYNLETYLYDELGRLVITKHLDKLTSGKEVKLYDNLNLTGGSYYLKINSQNGTISQLSKVISVE